MRTRTLPPPRHYRRSLRTAPRILCLNDNGGVRDVVCQVLSFAGFRCETVTNTGALIQRLSDGPRDVDLRIADHQPSGLNGLALVRELRQRGFHGKIIIHATWLRAGERTCYHALGVYAVLTKPVDFAALLQTVSELVPNKCA